MLHFMREVPQVTTETTPHLHWKSTYYIGPDVIQLRLQLLTLVDVVVVYM